MPVLELLASSGLGSLLGMRHALEPDHLAAVSTLVTGERSSYKAAFLGACWGLGHTVALIAVGTVFVLLRAQMPAAMASTLEFGVSVMLVEKPGTVLTAHHSNDTPAAVDKLPAAAASFVAGLLFLIAGTSLLLFACGTNTSSLIALWAPRSTLPSEWANASLGAARHAASVSNACRSSTRVSCPRRGITWTRPPSRR